jgi:hypothetical protein
MEAIFGGSLTTGKYAMGSNEPLGTDMGPVDAIAAEDKSDLASPEVQSGKGKETLGERSKGSDDKDRPARKRKLEPEEVDMLSGMIKAVESIGDALRTPQHNEVHADLYGCVMSYPGYTQETLMVALVYLLKNKAKGLCFVQMTEDHRILWLKTYLSTTNLV